MDFCLENRVFLQRNGKLLLFKENNLYNGDKRNIDDYVDRGQLKYITIENKNDELKQTNYYFANTTDQYLTQYGEWIYIEDAISLPSTQLVNFVLNNYYQEGQFNDKVTLVTLASDKISHTTISE